MGNDIKRAPSPARGFNPTKLSPEVVARAKELKAEAYVVKENDSAWVIAKRFNIPLEDLVQFNELKDPHSIRKGQTLYIPPAEPNRGWSAPAAANFLNGAAPGSQPPQTAPAKTGPISETENAVAVIAQELAQIEQVLTSAKKNVLNLKLAKQAPAIDESKLAPAVQQRLANFKAKFAEGQNPENKNPNIGKEVNDLANLLHKDGLDWPQLYAVARTPKQIDEEIAQYAKEIPDLERLRDEHISQLPPDVALQFLLYAFPFSYVDEATTNDKVLPQLLKYLTALDSVLEEGQVKEAVAQSLENSLKTIEPETAKEKERLEELTKQLSAWVSRN